MNDAFDILALFTNARRLHEGLTPSRLDALLGVPAGSTRAIERRRAVKPSTRAAFLKFNDLEQPRGEEAHRADREAGKPRGGEAHRADREAGKPRGEEGRSTDREAGKPRGEEAQPCLTS